MKHNFEPETVGINRQQSGTLLKAATVSQEAGQPQQPLVPPVEEIQATEEQKWLAISRLREQAEKEARKETHRTSRVGIGITLLTGGIVAMMLDGGSYVPVISAGLFCSLSGLITLLSGIRPNVNEGEFFHQLCALDSIYAIGPLAIIATTHKDLRAQANIALINLLPKLKASDAIKLSSSERDCLNNLLFDCTCRQRILATSILAALEQVGDESSLPLVERLARGEGAANGSQKIQEAAESCLLFLQERVEEKRKLETYLRASESPSIPGEILLRPVSSVSENGDGGANDLLRGSMTHLEVQEEGENLPRGSAASGQLSSAFPIGNASDATEPL